jgi:hypothetical protein
MKKIKEWGYFPFVLLGFMVLIMHLLMTGGWGDDADFSKVKLDSTLVDYLVNEYFTWSSRGIIELCVVLFSKLDFLIWSIFNTIIYTSIGVMLSKLLVKSNNKEMNYFIAGMMIIYPFYHMATAGWIATCTFYLYPLFCLIYCLLTIKKVFESKKISWHEYLFYAIAFLYASSMQQVAVIMTMFFAFLAVYIIANKLNYRHIVGISLIVSIAQVINAVICPGNKLRTLEESARFLPMFAEYTLFDKLNMGFYTTMISFLTSFDAVFLMFISLLFLTIMLKYRKCKFGFIAIIPFLIWIVFTPIRVLLKSPYSNLISENKFVSFIADVIKIGYIESIPSETLWLSLVLLIISLLILYSVVRAFDKPKIMAVLFILATGLISRILMGFSPTVYASSYRTFLYMYFSLIICLIILMNKQLPQLMEKKIFVYLFIAVCAFSYMLNLFKTVSLS